MEIIPFEKSVASHPKGAKYWSQKNIDNNGNFIKPESIKLSSHRQYLFECDVCNHTFLKRVADLKYGGWCNYCSHNVLCDDELCQICFENSFASCEDLNILACWSKENVDKEGKHITPRSIFKYTKKPYLFDCKDCGHQISQKPGVILNGSWCIYCAHLKLCDDEKCDYCYKNSFASTPEHIYWHNDNQLNARQVFKNANTKYHFLCYKCGDKFTQFPSVVFKEKSSCQNCTRQTESKVYQTLKNHYPTIQYNFYPQWCKNKKTNSIFPFDFVIHEYKVIIELDGEQHFIQVKNWLNVEECRRRDLYKMKCANENGYSVIRIFQKDVLKDRIEWLRTLQETIQEIIQRSFIHNYFISFDEKQYSEFIYN
jgi:very-short-patch-repair endonuclease